MISKQESDSVPGKIEGTAEPGHSPAARRARRAWPTVAVGAWSVAAIVVLASLALALRLVFIFDVSEITPIWDAAVYWEAAQYARDALCRHAPMCSPELGAGGNLPSLKTAVDNALVTRSGTLPFFLAAAMTLLPFRVETGLVIWAVLDVLVCLMVVSICVRWGMPLWAGLLGGLLQATYVPGITGDGALLQQPGIRFFLVFVVWAYTRAFSVQRQTSIWLWVGVGSLAALFAGLSSLPNRLLLWVILGTVLGLGIAFRKSHVRNAQLASAAVVLCLVAILAALQPRLAGPTDVGGLTSKWSTVAFGLTDPTPGGARESTVLSFPEFWPPDEWWIVGFDSSDSVFEVMARNPAALAGRLAHSLFYNWLYPDHLYFQEFLLNLDGQRFQHWLLVLFGLAGLAWLLRHRGAHLPAVLLTVIVAVYVALVSSVVSVEPRRVGVLVPFFACGAAAAIWAGVRLAAQRPHIPPRTVGLIAMVTLAWVTPISWVADLLPGAVGAAHTGLVLLRVVSGSLLAVALIAPWTRANAQFRAWAAVAFALAVACVIGAGQLRDTEWRAWAADLHSGEQVRQEIDGLNLDPHLFPWLLVDVGAMEQASSAEIIVNGEVVKPHEAPLYVWRAGEPPLWSPYLELERMSNFNVPQRTWLAVPLSRDAILTSTNTVEVASGAIPLTLWGDYFDASQTPYTGPSVDPWRSGTSLWRWQWNAEDPRIPSEQVLSDGGYTSAVRTSSGWTSGDLSPRPGRQLGLFRIFITQVAFGPRTNALLPLASAPMAAGPTPACTSGVPLTARVAGSPLICLVENALEYRNPDGTLVGRSPIELFTAAAQRDKVIVQVAREGLRVEVVSVLYRRFVANFYSAGGNLEYSLYFQLNV